MAQGYVNIRGSRQGQFTGNSTKNDRKGKWIEVLSFSSAVQSPRDIATGQASGKRQHRSFSIVMEQGLASQQMLHALTTNEVLKDVTFEFVDKANDGKEYVHHTIKLTNATISSIRHEALVTSGPIRHAYVVKFESDTMETTHVALTFQRIEVSHAQGKKSAHDDWDPNAH